MRDQRHRVLTLYFSRALERTDYVLAKYLALLCAIALVLAVPAGDPAARVALRHAQLRRRSRRGGAEALAGRRADDRDLGAARWGRLVASAFTVRRSFAAGAIIAVFLVSSGVVTVLVNRVGLEGRCASSRSPIPLP